MILDGEKREKRATESRSSVFRPACAFSALLLFRRRLFFYLGKQLNRGENDSTLGDITIIV